MIVGRRLREPSCDACSSIGLELGEFRSRIRDPFWPTSTTTRILLLAVLAVSVALRCYRLTTLFPVLVDEAIYMRWAEIIQHQHEFFVSLLDPKPPFIYWVYASIRPLFGGNLLLGSRLISVLAGGLSTLGIYRIGYLCRGAFAGLAAAGLYGILPYAALYDRIAYVDSIVNFWGILLVYSCLISFGRYQLSPCRTVMTGVAFGVALFTKTTALLFGLGPLVVAVHCQRSRMRACAPHLLSVYALASLFPVWAQLAIPPGPRFSIGNTLLHHTNFFTPVSALVRSPDTNLGYNLHLIAGFASAYVGYPCVLGALGAVCVLLVSKRYLPLLIAMAYLGGIVFIVFVMQYFPSRYAFPLAWPVLLLIGCAANACVGSRRRFAVYGLLVIIGAATLRLCLGLLSSPETRLHANDAYEFLGSGPYSGSGVAEAIDLLRAKAREGPITILADPWWGPPTDVVFADLNQVAGTRVFEAWWLQLGNRYPLVPDGEIPVWRSQYQRIAAAMVDFSKVQRLYYITDSNYFNPSDVHTMCPDARLLQRFPKRDGSHFIDVYVVKQ